MKQLKQTITVLTLAAMLLARSWVPMPVYAEDVTPTSAPEQNTVQNADTPQNTSTTETTPTPTPEQTQNVVQSDTPVVITPTPTPDPRTDRDGYIEMQRQAAEAAYKAGNTGSGATGGTKVTTGDATNSGTATTVGNANTSTSGGSATTAGSGPSMVVGNTGNGAGSDNNSSASVVGNNDTNQNNSANVGNSLGLTTTTGQNTSSLNVGDSTLKTGDANTSGTAITSVNTNMDGVMVSEFNIADDHVGDILLSPEAFVSNCISGCGGTGGSATNTGNGALSNNNAGTSTDQNNNTFQNNDASVGNNLILGANSGSNESSLNTGGNTTITTGDANVSANSLTFANNNFAGNVYYGVVNIYGDLQGDIILPDFSSGSTDSAVANTGNGADSTNTATSNNTSNNNTAQNNDVTINNNLVFDANTGNNGASNNTDGNTTVSTGQTKVDANVLNIANSNIDGGTWYLVLVNEAGNWIGHLIGSPDGAHMAGSEGTTFNISPDGQITASNNANGAGSENTATSNSISNNNTTQNNNAEINNTLNLSANTGNNQTNYNTGGNNNIVTGDAQIIANLVNFVNNNIVGNGKLVVTVVNVFGSWLGDFVTPGHTKEVKTASVSNNSGSNTQSSQGSTTQTTQSAVQGASYTNTGNGISSNGTSAAGIWGQVTSTFTQKESNKTTPKVAVLSEKTFGHPLTKQQLSINLAWILLLGPVLVIGRFARRTLTARHLPRQ